MASLTLHISKEQDGDYCLRFEYAAEKFREDTVRRMAEVYGAIVAGLSEGQKLCGIPLTTVGTQSEMDAWNETKAPYPVTDVVSLFRQAVESDPERTVLGHVLFSQTTQKRAWLDSRYQQLAKLRSLLYPEEDQFKEFYETGFLPLEELLPEQIQEGMGPYGWGAPYCYDCTAAGGTQRKPDFWDDAE
jgi:non-ribosomal peptide synthetase component F